GLVDELECAVEELFVHCLHALHRQRTGVFNLLRTIRVRPGLEYAPRPKLLLELLVLRIVGILRLLLGVEVIEVAEELVEAVCRRQKLVPIAEVVLAKLSAHVAERLQDVGDGRVVGLESQIGAWKPDLRQAGANRRLARDERRTSGRAALLA